MSDHQADLFGSHPPARRHRLFFALFPDAGERMQLRQLAQDLGAAFPHARWIRPERYHLTLHYLGESDGRRDDLIARALQAVEGFQASAFAVELDHLLALGNPRRPALTLAARDVSPPLLRFWRSLQERLIRAGFKQHVGHAFVPHLTLAYIDPQPPAPPIAAVRLQPRGFRLIHSVEGEAEYEVLGQWELPAPSPPG